MPKIISLALNATSFGNISVNILFELYLRNLDDFILFDIGQPDLSVFDKLRNYDDFINFVNRLKNNPTERYCRDMSGFRLWHVNGSESSVCNKNNLYTFYELDSPTKLELNILENQNNVAVSCEYTKNILLDNGLKTPIHVVPLFFDDLHYYLTEDRKKIHADVCVWSIGPIKWEKRKWTEKAIRCWIKKYGKNHQHILNLACFNPFLSPEDNNRFLINCFNGEKPFNVNVQPYMSSLFECNSFINFSDICIDPSGAEGWSYPSFTSLCLGKHVVAHNVTGIKEWADQSNCTLFEPDGKTNSADGIFFHPNLPYNQGNIFYWEEDNFMNALDIAYKKWQDNKINVEGFKVKDKFTRVKFVDSILKLF